MCTLSWWIDQESRGVFFNRDEKFTRSRGLPPQVVKSEGYDILMPVDPDAGGTWIGVNEMGVVVALLNNYPHYQETSPDQRSRGQLVFDLLKQSESATDCMQRLSNQNLRRYRGFLLFTMDSESKPQASDWAGISLRPIPLLDSHGLHLLTTSSVRSEACIDYRRNLFCRNSRTPDYLRRKHHHFEHSDTALGPLMIRDDAATDSFTEVRLNGASSTMSFQAISSNPPELAPPVIRKIAMAIAK
ncbi:MAG: NRDE family protein [Verrucomicrobiota bacterium]